MDDTTKTKDNLTPHWHEQYNENLSCSDRVADVVAKFIGSWKFLIIQSGFFALWVLVNTLTLFKAIRWDEYPYILFNLFMSAEAAYATPLIMMSQNRQALRDRHQADADYECNVSAKEEIEVLQKDIARIEMDKLDKIILLLEPASVSASPEPVNSGSASAKPWTTT